jgi:hypothetical protein
MWAHKHRHGFDLNGRYYALCIYLFSEWCAFMTDTILMLTLVSKTLVFSSFIHYCSSFTSDGSVETPIYIELSDAFDE